MMESYRAEIDFCTAAFFMKESKLFAVRGEEW